MNVVEEDDFGDYGAPLEKRRAVRSTTWEKKSKQSGGKRVALYFTSIDDGKEELCEPVSTRSILMDSRICSEQES
jgi:hypothetical protein